jgi:hypothetical protein
MKECPELGVGFQHYITTFAAVAAIRAAIRQTLGSEKMT